MADEQYKEPKSSKPGRLGAGSITKSRAAPFIVYIIVVLLLPRLAGNNYKLGLLNQIGMYAIVAVGLNLLMGLAGQISLGHAGFYGLGAYTSACIAVHLHQSPWLGLIAAMIFCGITAFIVGIPTLKLKGHYLALATLGLGIILFTLFQRLVGITGGPDGMVSVKLHQITGVSTIPPFSLGAFKFNTETRQLYLIWGVLFFVLLISNNIVNSRVGRALKALHASEGAANVLGINTAKYKLMVFTLSAMFAGAAGSLYAHYAGYMSPGVFTLLASIKFVVMVVVGGMSSIWGTVFGVGLLEILPQVLSQFADFDIVIYGSVLILVLIFLPQGIVKGLVELKRQILPGKDSESADVGS